MFDFKALSFRVTSVTDKDTINAYIIDKEIYPGYLVAFAYLPSFIGLRRAAGPALGGDGKVDAEPEKQIFSRISENSLSPELFAITKV